jgi:DNA-binding SARP family transcriptional activator
LARLAMAPGGQMSRAQLAEVLWPGDSFDASRLRMRQELTRLRKSLGDFERILVTTTGSVRLDASTYDFDIAEFEELIRLARQSERLDRKVSLLRQAIAISSSPFMSAAGEDWIRVEGARLGVVRKR